MSRLAVGASEFFLLVGTSLLSLFAPSVPQALAASGKPSLVISQVDGSHFPTAMTYATVLSDKGYPVAGLTESNFWVTENGIRARNFSVRTAVDVEEPLAAVLTLDVSGSMLGNPMSAEKAAATKFVDGLRPQDQTSVIAFSSDVRQVLDFTHDKTAVAAAIDGLDVGGNTALYDALFTSVDIVTRAVPLRRTVVFMTDGRNTKSLASLEDGLNLATQQGVPVYTIGLGADLDREVLTRIARQTGGASLFAPTPTALEAAYQAITDQLRSQYVITYESPAPKGARTYRTTLTATVGGESVNAERNYEANPLAPSIEALSLQDGQRIEGIVDVSMEVASALPITAAKLVLNGREIERLTAAPFNFRLDASGLSAGRQEISISASDAAGSETTRRLQVLVTPMGTENWPSPQRPEAEARLASVPAPTVGVSIPSLPSIDLPVLMERLGSLIPRLELPRIELPTIDPAGWPGVTLLAAVVPLVSQAADSFRQAPLLVDGVRQDAAEAINAVTRQAESATPRVGMIAMILVGSLLMVLAGKRAISVGREQRRQVNCDACGAMYRAIEQECPHCEAQREQANARERPLGDFLVQNNLLTPEGLNELLQKSDTTKKSLELTALEEGLISARELSQARFYLAHSAEMQDRLSDALQKNRAGNHTGGLRRLLPAASVPISLGVVAITTMGAALPNI